MPEFHEVWDGVCLKQDRDGTYRVTHPYLERWIKRIPTKEMAKKILDAFKEIQDTTNRLADDDD
jgi:hypothetical protein